MQNFVGITVLIGGIDSAVTSELLPNLQNLAAPSLDGVVVLVQGKVTGDIFFASMSSIHD